MNSEISSAGADHHPCMEMETYQHLAERYSLVLERAKKYLSKERKHRSGGTISDTRKQALLEAGAECPMCGDQFRDRSFNTEHIHSRCLGGEKSCNDNRTAICIPCNNARTGSCNACSPTLIASINRLVGPWLKVTCCGQS